MYILKYIFDYCDSRIQMCQTVTFQYYISVSLKRASGKLRRKSETAVYTFF